MTRKSVQVHTSHLPWRATRNCSPLLSCQLQRCQHLKRNIRNFTALVYGTALERFEIANEIRQSVGVVIAADKITEQRCVFWSLCLGRTRLSGRRKRRTWPHFPLQQICGRGCTEPLAEKT